MANYRLLSYILRLEAKGYKVRFVHIAKTFKVVPWFNWCDRFNKDYEVLPATSETMIRVAMIGLIII